MPSKSRHWTAEELTTLQYDWSTKTVRQLAKELDRTKIAILRKANALKLGGTKRGKSLRQVARETGFSDSTIVTVMANIGIEAKRARRRPDRPWKGKPKTRHYVISYIEERKIIKYLREHRCTSRVFRHDAMRTPQGMWGVGTKPTECARCGRAERPHYARGKCKACYNASREGRELVPQVKPTRCPVTGRWAKSQPEVREPVAAE